MAALNFPSSPTVGQKYPVPSLTGIPTYTWDGEKWTTQATDIGVGGFGFVAKSGDTMTGNLVISKADPTISLTKSATSQNSTILGYNVAAARWGIQFGNSTAESGSNAGSDFAINRFNDAGTYIDNPLYISRGDGKVYINPADPTAANGVATKSYVDGKVVAVATTAEYLANTAPTKMLTSGATWGAGPVFVLTDAATVTPDFNVGIDFYWTIAAVGRTFANPTNTKQGQKGVIYLIQDGTGSRTITTWGSAWKFPGGTKPVLSTSANSIDAVSYAVVNSTLIVCTFSAGFA